MKTFATMPVDGNNWQDITVFSGDNNRIALQNIEYIVLLEPDLDIRPLLLLPQRLKRFPRLKRVDHAFGFSTQITRGFIDRVMQLKCVRQRNPPVEALEHFRVLGIKVDELDMGIIETDTCPINIFEGVISSQCIVGLM